MHSRGRWALLASNAAVALIGAVVMFAVVRYVAVENEPSHEGEPETAAEQPIDRLAFSHPGAIGPNASAGPGTLLEPDEREERENVDPWSTESRSEPVAPLKGPTAPGFSLRFPWQTPPAAPPAPQRNYTLKARIAELAPAATARLTARFEAAKAPWPPAEIAMIAIKDERALELHARPAGGPWKLVHRYKVLAASGSAGPKLRQGDRQVPEGIYNIAFLNPNSAYHVSLRVGYPNAFDRQMAAKDGRKDLGGDIMIHGKNLSAGCLAMGDEAVEEIFVLAAQTGLSNVKVIIAPTDFREKGVPKPEPGKPEWLPAL